MIALIEQIQNGDVHAYGIFFRQHYARLLNYCRLFIKGEDEAEDLVQEAFVKLWENRHELDPERSVEALLYISVRNRCLNFLRDRDLKREKFQNYKQEVEQRQFLVHFDYLGEEEIPLEERLFVEVDIAIEALPNRCKEVLRLSRFEGLKNSEVAKRLGISVKAVEKQLSVGKKKISAQLKDKYPLGLVLFLLWF